MLKICLVVWKSEPQYAYKRYVYKKNMYQAVSLLLLHYIDHYAMTQKWLYVSEFFGGTEQFFLGGL